MDRSRLLADVKSAEGCRLAAYRDSLGFWTIGYGHKLPTGKDWGSGYAWTQDEADEQLSRDLDARGVLPAAGLMEWKFLDTDARQNAVAELCFNMGVGHWRAFVHTRMAITKRDWQAAHDGLLDSEWAKQVQPEGLTFPDGKERPGRATRLANYLLTGEF